VRVPIGAGPAKPPHIQSEPAYKRGLVEIQDEGSQIAAALAKAKPGELVLDLCAGAGGKTLAMAAEMQNKGTIHVYDADKRRFGDLFERLERAAVRLVDVRHPERPDPLGPLEGRMDLVLVDAPCTGTGTWRRRPDAKWRVAPNALAGRMREQDEVLAKAARMVRPGGRVVYITCSVLPEENEDRIAAFLSLQGEFTLEPPGPGSNVEAAVKPFVRMAPGLGPVARLTPRSAGTDGFFVACLRKR
jgi:16S rRNA (cytosine967-C5)-methyltransferase